MSPTPQQAPPKIHRDSQWTWVFVALLAHTGWGAYPVFARYLQTVSRLPSMSLMALGNLVPLIIVSFTILPRIDKRVFRSRFLWMIAVVIVLRATTNLLATRYTLSIYVQLITQMTPFLVALLSTVLLREKLPRYTGRAITLCLAGAIMMMGSDIGQTVMQPTADRIDGLGIGLALVSSLILATYMILVRRTVSRRVPGEAVLVVHLTSLLISGTVISLLLGETWQQWRAIGLADWLIFAGFSLGVLLGANLGQISSLRHLGAPLVSSLLAWRLVSALVVGALLLGERLSSLLQLLGAGIVLVTITWYLWQQRNGEDGESNRR